MLAYETIFSLDDDKVPVSGIGAGEHGIAAHKIKKNWNPVYHRLNSLITGLHVAHHLERRDDTVQDCIEILLTKATDEPLFKNIKLDNLTAKDRQYNTMNTSRHCVNLSIIC